MKDTTAPGYCRNCDRIGKFTCDNCKWPACGRCSRVRNYPGKEKPVRICAVCSKEGF